MSSGAVVHGQFLAYNDQDLERFCSFYAPDCVLATLNGPVLAEGIEAVRKRHKDLFAKFPKNKARLLSRIVVGEGVVIDHEDVERAPGGERFEVAAIYTLRDGRIARVDFARSA
ncbi:MAG: nuclear transport factor 2 family protein [Hyphomonadaceae bacterium]|nr:nuclear transport factor 2 family protein [Hyphomonadaceae bacterium]